MKVIKLGFERVALYSFDGISKALFIELLNHLPNDAAIQGFGYDAGNMVDYVFITSNQFPDTSPGTSVPEATIVFQSVNGVPHVDRIEYPNQMTATTGCLHQWEVYHGFSSTETYCKVCGIKKP